MKSLRLGKTMKCHIIAKGLYKFAYVFKSCPVMESRPWKIRSVRTTRAWLGSCQANCPFVQGPNTVIMTTSQH